MITTIVVKSCKLCNSNKLLQFYFFNLIQLLLNKCHLSGFFFFFFFSQCCFTVGVYCSLVLKSRVTFRTNTYCFFSFFIWINQSRYVTEKHMHLAWRISKCIAISFPFSPQNLHQSLISQFLRSFNPQQWSKTQWNPEVGPDESESWWIRRWNARDTSCHSEEPGGCSLCCTVWTSILGCKGNDGALYVRVLLNSISDDRTMTHPAR